MTANVTVSGPAPDCYRVIRGGLPGETLHEVEVAVSYGTAADAKRAVASGLARLEAVRDRFREEWRAREEASGRESDRWEPRSRDARWLAAVTRLEREAGDRLGSIAPVLKYVPDGSLMDEGWGAIRAGLQRVEEAALAVGMTRDES